MPQNYMQLFQPSISSTGARPEKEIRADRVPFQYAMLGKEYLQNALTEYMFESKFWGFILKTQTTIEMFLDIRPFSNGVLEYFIIFTTCIIVVFTDFLYCVVVILGDFYQIC